MPLFLSPTAMQSLYDPEGDKASARAAEKFDTIYSMSTMASFSIEEVANVSSGPKLFQLYIHKDKSITCLLYTSPSPRDATLSRMPSPA